MRCTETREITAVSLTVSKNFTVGLHADIFDLIWLKAGIVIDNIETYILILEKLNMTFIQGHRIARKQTFLFQLFRKVID